MRVKATFIGLYIPALLVGVIYAGYNLSQDPGSFLWLGALISLLPMMIFFTSLVVVNLARTSNSLLAYQIPIWIGIVLSAYDNQGQWWVVLYCFSVGTGGSLLYIYWYSSYGREENQGLAVGQQLPSFVLETENKTIVSSESFIGNTTLLMFYRGNWCPLCVAQVKEVSAQYKAMVDKGVNVILVSPQSHKHTADIAKKFDVPFAFLVDVDNEAARILNIVDEGGLPLGVDLLGYGLDTVMPTVLITDKAGKIIFSDLTDNYRVRPEPETFMKVINALPA